ncbi:MAG: hypothetical protein HQK83_12315 [Fibrobacteria bacterium]|nr:hypothetical protein [Fibrobacteria bacterium]
MNNIPSSIKLFLSTIALAITGMVFSWRLTEIPSRIEITIIVSALIIIPSLKFPKIAIYYIFFISLFVPVLRRMYYLIDTRPKLDFLMLLSDGAMASLFISIIMFWIINKQQNKDRLSFFILIYIFFLFMKIFVLNTGSTIDGFYGFKFYGLFTLFYFAANTLIEDKKAFFTLFRYSSFLLLFVALYSFKQVFFGYFNFENIWADSVQFTTLFIEGRLRTFSTLASPAALSDAMNILFILGCFNFIKPTATSKIFGMILMAATAVPLLYASVRTNWICAILSIWIFYIFIKRLSFKITLINLAVIPLALFFLLNYGEFNSSNQSNTTRPTKGQDITEVMITNRTRALTNPFDEYSFQKRLDTWIYIIYEIYYTYPLGKGLGVSGYAHSFYIQVLGDTGYIGALLFLIILITIIVRGIIIVRHEQDQEKKNLAAMCTTIVIIVSILNITGTHLNSHPSDIFFWFCAGCIGFLYQEYKDEANTPEATIEDEKNALVNAFSQPLPTHLHTNN